MTPEKLEQRLTSLEHAVSELRQKVDPVVTSPKKPWERATPPMTEEEVRSFGEMLEYGRYFRRTGREAPLEWKPGDPIPEPEFDE